MFEELIERFIAVESIQESVSELIHEVPGLTKDEKGALTWAIENGIIDNTFPSMDAMRSALKGHESQDLKNSSDLRIAYMRDYLAPLAYSKQHK